MSKTDFKISYGGPAVENGTMDVSDLAPALLAVGEIFREINKELNGERAEVKTNVVAVKEGCFDAVIPANFFHQHFILSSNKMTRGIEGYLPPWFLFL